MDYTTFITKARSLSTQSEKSNVAFMRLLVDVYRVPDIWRDKYRSWADLLKAEGLCTITKFNAFSKGLNEGLPVNTLGVNATCLLATYPKNIRASALASTLGWVKTHRVPPKYQLVAEYVKGLSVRPKKPTRVQKYKAYVAQLQAILAKNRLVYPEGPLPSFLIVGAFVPSTGNGTNHPDPSPGEGQRTDIRGGLPRNRRGPFPLVGRS